MKKNEIVFAPDTEKYFSEIKKCLNDNYAKLMQMVECELPRLMFENISSQSPWEFKDRMGKEIEAFRIFLTSRQILTPVTAGRLDASKGFAKAVIFSFFKTLKKFFDTLLPLEASHAAWMIIDAYAEVYLSSFMETGESRIYREQSGLHESLIENMKRESDALLQKEKKEKLAKWLFFIEYAHDSRTPISLMRDYIHDLHAEFPAEKPRALSLLDGLAESLWQTNMNILDQEKIERHQKLYDHSDIVEISELVSLKCDLFAPLAGAKSIRIISKVKEKLFVQINHNALDRILNNIIDNAIKYSRENGHIHVCLKGNAKQVVLTVRDWGIGIPAERMETIYAPYYEKFEECRGKTGIGAGLCIVKKITEEASGKIKLRSKVYKGTTVIFIFPRVEVNAENRNTVRQITTLSKPVFRPDTSLEPDKYDENRRTLLFVDDDEEFLFHIRERFKKKHNCICARSAEEALERTASMPEIDLIVSDIKMKGMDGFDFTEKVKLKSKRIFVILLTGITEERGRLKGLKMGAIDYLRKPFPAEELEAKIESILDTRDSAVAHDIEKIRGIVLGAFTKKKKETKNFFIEQKCEEFGLSKQEKKVLLFLLDGVSVKDTAVKMNLSVFTIRKYIREIYRSCNLHDRVAFLNFFRE